MIVYSNSNRSFQISLWYFVLTAVPPPEELIVLSEMPTSAEVMWGPPRGMEKISHSYQISYDRGESKSESKPIYTDKCSTIITDLQPGTTYNVSVRTKLDDVRMSAPFRQPVCTGESSFLKSKYRSLRAAHSLKSCGLSLNLP